MTSSDINNSNEKSYSVKQSDFSIEHILNRAGAKTIEKRETKQVNPSVHEMVSLGSLEWLNCTRYKPPRLAHKRKDGTQRPRQAGRHPRIPFSAAQVAALEAQFKRAPYLSSTDVTRLARALQLADIRVKIWFQNRRARERREKSESLNSCTESQTSPNNIFYQNQIIDRGSTTIDVSNSKTNEFTVRISEKNEHREYVASLIKSETCYQFGNNKCLERNLGYVSSIRDK